MVTVYFLVLEFPEKLMTCFTKHSSGMMKLMRTWCNMSIGIFIKGINFTAV